MSVTRTCIGGGKAGEVGKGQSRWDLVNPAKNVELNPALSGSS